MIGVWIAVYLVGGFVVNVAMEEPRDGREWLAAVILAPFAMLLALWRFQVAVRRSGR